MKGQAPSTGPKRTKKDLRAASSDCEDKDGDTASISTRDTQEALEPELHICKACDIAVFGPDT